MSGKDKVFWWFIAIMVLAALAGGTQAGTGSDPDPGPMKAPCTETFRGGC